MKIRILFFLITVSSLNCYSQISFEKGYFIDDSNQKTDCLIKNNDWKNSPTQFKYKLSPNSESKTATIQSIKEFGIDNSSKYVKRTVNIDRSSEILDNLSKTNSPIFKEEQLFLKVLVEGKATLYQYIDGNLKRYFYTIENSDIEQLIFKSYKTSDNKIGENNTFRQQLWNNLKCPKFKISEIEGLEYKANSLVNLFVKYNNCTKQEYVNYESKPKRDLFNLTIRPRINNSSLEVAGTYTDARDTNFGNKINLDAGIEAEFILPFNKNKWAIAIEPTYHSYKNEERTDEINVSGGILIANVDYSSIEIPLGLRHYFFLNNESKIFINASYNFDISSNTLIEYSRVDGLIVSNLENEAKSNLGFGIGFKQNDKYSLETRFQTDKEILGDYLYWSSDYKKLSLIFGYSLF